MLFFFFFQAEDGIRDHCVTGVQTCALPIYVQSTAVSPGAGSRSSMSSPARTGTCARVMSRRMAKALSDPDDLVRQLPLIGLPGLPIPHLEVIEVADQDDLLLDPRVRE